MVSFKNFIQESDIVSVNAGKKAPVRYIPSGMPDKSKEDYWSRKEKYDIWDRDNKGKYTDKLADDFTNAALGLIKKMFSKYEEDEKPVKWFATDDRPEAISFTIVVNVPFDKETYEKEKYDDDYPWWWISQSYEMEKLVEKLTKEINKTKGLKADGIFPDTSRGVLVNRDGTIPYKFIIAVIPDN